LTTGGGVTAGEGKGKESNSKNNNSNKKVPRQACYRWVYYVSRLV
jgi:hypothetical protein